jgi:Flp pilus assembly protein TadB
MSPVLVWAWCVAAALLAPRGGPTALPPRLARRRASGAPARGLAATVGDAATATGLLAAALRGGTGSVECLEAVARVDRSPAGRELAVVAAAHRWGEEPGQAWAHVGPGWAAAAVAWHVAVTAGAAPADLLDDAATRIRRAEARRREAAGHRAGVLLVIPLGLCFLPGFVGTTVAPVVLHLVGALVP